ncbi:hypothetical protein BOTBODRAFT_170305 [Botryobasidium botryosum FD-172 SS1]|uniref:GST N-terminal domain-containing protein n=1 Tax=Botryobasidium botryosum (strain FD-172 SS1) TaxID=930990 RepID=A0A067MXM0_BOTB1|nr:hypothetical protein BOTBODRAFT_170305 [Botryobasidium botryosum FD-172 SS1]
MLKLTYFNVRGRCFPLLLLLVDSGAAFDYEEVTTTDWIDMKRSDIIAPPEYPFLGLPTLEYELDGMREILGETGAIGKFLEGRLRPEGSAERSLHLRARLEMVREASAFFVNRIFQLSSDPDWLAPPSRDTVKAQVTQFLGALEYNLAALASDIIPAPSDQLLAATASAFAALWFSGDLFPSLRAQMTAGGLYPTCARLVETVEQRSRIRKWLEEGDIKQKAWTVRPSGQMPHIQEQANRYD